MQMKQIAITLCLCLSLFTLTACGRAADSSANAADAAPGAVLAQDELKAYKEDPANTEALVDFTNVNFEALQKEMSGPSDVTQKHIDGIRESLADVDPGDNEEAANILATIDRSLEAFEQRVVAKDTPLEEIKSDLAEDPSDIEMIELYATKIGMTFMNDLSDDIKQREDKLEEEAKFLITNAEKVEASDVKIAYRKAAMVFKSASEDIERLKTYAKVVGEDMKPIDAQAWVNANGFKPEDLEGKVILLDFWAVWCGPCVAGFPHLTEWQEKYGDEGLQVVGITRYFNFDWPEGAAGPSPSEDGEVPPAKEEAMLDKFTAEYDLKHPTALVSDPDDFYDYYAVSVIPHMVLIGRDGKIRKVVGGITEARMKSIDEEIQKLLAEPKPEPKQEAKADPKPEPKSEAKADQAPESDKNAKPEPTKSDEAAPEETASEETKSEQPESEETESGETKSEETKSE